MSIVSELLADNWQVETMVQKKPDLQMRALLLGVKCVYTNTHTHTHTHTDMQKEVEKFCAFIYWCIINYYKFGSIKQFKFTVLKVF